MNVVMAQHTKGTRMADTTKDVDKTTPLVSTEQYRRVVSWDDALALASETWGDIADASAEIGDGFAMLDNKGTLEDAEMMLLGWAFSTSDTYRDPVTGEFATFCVARVVTKSGDKWLITDGSPHGICGQLLQYTERTGKQGGLYVKRGLRHSTYDLPDGSGKGTTHYINA